jgi:hypothetical protein
MVPPVDQINNKFKLAINQLGSLAKYQARQILASESLIYGKSYTYSTY